MSASTVPEITYFDLIWVFALVLLLGIISLVESLKLERDLAIAVARTVIQLTLMGLFLRFVFGAENIFIILGLMLIMLLVAMRTAHGRFKRKIPAFQILVLLSLGTGAAITTFFVIVMTIRPEPWWTPQILLPLFGMILGNAMNGTALAGERLQSELDHRQLEIETLLSLGYSSKEASREVRRSSIKAGLIPTINSMMVVGIVSLPGLMTGQIISGVDPVLAVRYQIMVMFMIAGAAGIASWLMIGMMLKRYFTPYHQLRYWML